MKNKNKLLLALSTGVVLGYSFYKGKGAFNKIRFKRQFEALKSYVDTHYPEAVIGEIVPFKSGWSCNILSGDQNIIIYIVENDGSGFIFSPTEM